MTNTKKTPSSLLDHARRVARRVEEVDFDHELPAEPDAEGDAFGRPGDILANASVGTILATTMLLDALAAPERRRLMRQRGLAMVVKVPAPVNDLALAPDGTLLAATDDGLHTARLCG